MGAVVALAVGGYWWLGNESQTPAPPAAGPALQRRAGQKPYRIAGLSMAPDFSDGEPVTVDENAYKEAAVGRRDVIAFKFALSPEARVKRVAAIPGDQLTFLADKILINEQNVNTAAYNPEVWPPGQTITVPPDMYFVLSDNLAGGEDSRQWGYVERRAILGQVRR